MPVNATYNLHFIIDSPYADWYAEKCMHNSPPGVQNRFICFSKNPAYVKHKHIEIYDHTAQSFDLLIREINSNTYKAVYFNFLENWQVSVINHITSKNVKLVWIVWGGDLYRLPRVKAGVYDKFSKKHKGITLKSKIKKEYQRLRYMYSWEKKQFKECYKAIRRMDYCATPMTLETALIQKRLNKNIKQIYFAMLDAEELVPVQGTGNTTEAGKTAVLVGNSADPSNNHYEVLKKIATFNISNPIICPLSYGDKQYAEKLVAETKAWFKPGQFQPLPDFMPRDAYYNLLHTVNVAIMGHNIQKAFGNIMGLLCAGVKIYFKPGNLLYKELKKMGLVVFSMKELDASSFATALPQEAVRHNRNMILNQFSKEAVDKQYFNLLGIKAA